MPADAEAMAAYRSRPEVCTYIPPEPMGADALRERIEDRYARCELVDDGDACIMGVELDGAIVGDVMLRLEAVAHRGGEIGWVVHPDAGGRGVATEAAHGVLHLAFDHVGLHRVTARVDVRNDPSIRLAERLGMRREAHLKENEWFKGGWSDELDFALLEREWHAQHARGRAPSCCGATAG